MGDDERNAFVESIEKMENVDYTENGDGDNPLLLLEEIGKELWQLEDLSGLDCHFRDMREKIESLLNIGFRHIPRKSI
jgi:hypothetical protein